MSLLKDKMEVSCLLLKMEHSAAINSFLERQSLHFSNNILQVMLSESQHYSITHQEQQQSLQMGQVCYGVQIEIHLTILLKTQAGIEEKSMRISQHQLNYQKQWNLMKDQFYQMLLLRKNLILVNISSDKEMKETNSTSLKMAQLMLQE